METLLAVLLYIGAISTNIEYTETQIYSFESQNQTTVDQIMNDPIQMNDVDSEFEDNGIEIHGGDKIIVTDEIDF